MREINRHPKKGDFIMRVTGSTRFIFKVVNVYHQADRKGTFRNCLSYVLYVFTTSSTSIKVGDQRYISVNDTNKGFDIKDYYLNKDETMVELL